VRVALYNQPAGGGIGGSEFAVAVLAAALRSEHDVEILHHVNRMNRDELASRAGVDLSGVRLRYVPPPSFEHPWSRNPGKRLVTARRWLAELSQDRELFVVFTHHVPPFCHADRGVLVVLFPFAERPSVEAKRPTPLARAGAAATRAFEDMVWRKRFETYDAKVAISGFTRGWTARRWDVSCDVVYPPVDTDFPSVEKEPLVLSVGRFSTTGQSKKQAELVRLFASVGPKRLPGWAYICAGDLGTSPDDRTYFDAVSGHARDSAVTLLPNLPRDELRRLYSRASIFWHGTGLGEDDTRHPERAEHFGIATVEAMAAGCVPVVIDKGGQREIVEHGVSGFLCASEEELLEQTRALAFDRRRMERMGAEARIRARQFHRDRYVTRMLEICLRR